jgi:hypothetical protein
LDQEPGQPACGVKILRIWRQLMPLAQGPDGTAVLVCLSSIVTDPEITLVQYRGGILGRASVSVRSPVDRADFSGVQ